MQEFTDLVDEICIGARLTREQIGQLLGVKRRTVQSWLAGQRMPKPETQEKIRRLHSAVKSILGWRGVDVQSWMHSGTPSGFDLLLREDYLAFGEQLEHARQRRRVLPSQVRYVARSQRPRAAREEPKENEAATPDDLMSAWLSSVRERANVPRRRAPGWFPKGYEPATDTGERD
jgi:transcriptional regulator with XRE-family HTH domain